MKYICTVAHEQPGDEPGRFKAFNAGEVYELSGDYDITKFTPVGAAADELKEEYEDGSD